MDKSSNRYKSLGENPYKFNIGDIIVDALGFEYEVIDPDKRGMSILKNTKTKAIKELNAHNNPQFKLVKKASKPDKVTATTTAKAKEDDVSPEIKKEIDDLAVLFNKEKDFAYKRNGEYFFKYSDRYITLRRIMFPEWQVLERFFGKPLSEFKKNDIVGSTGRNSDFTSYKIVDINVAKDEVTLESLSSRSPNHKGSIKAKGSHWELITPKQSLFKAYEKYMGSKPDKVAPKKLDKVVPPPSMKYVQSPALNTSQELSALVAKYIYAKTQEDKSKLKNQIKNKIDDLKKYLTKPDIQKNKKWSDAINSSISSAMSVINSNVLGQKNETMIKQNIPTKPEKLNFDYLLSSNSGDRPSPTQSAGQLRKLYGEKPKYEKELFSTLFQGNDKNWYKLIEDKDGVWRWSKADDSSSEIKDTGSSLKIDIDEKIAVVKQKGKPLSSFKNGDRVFWADFTQGSNFKTYVEGSVLKKGNEYQIKRFPQNPISKKYPIAIFDADTKVVSKPDSEAIYMGEESLRITNKQEPKVEKKPTPEKSPAPKSEAKTEKPKRHPEYERLAKEYHDKYLKELTPRNVAKRLIYFYVFRGDDLKGSHMGTASQDYWASIGGYVNGKNIGQDKILVEKIKGKEVNQIFSLNEIINEIKKEAGLTLNQEKTTKSKPANTKKDLEDALAGAKAYLKYAKDNEKSGIKAYIRGLEILLK